MKRHYICVVISGILWGFMGMFIKILNGIGVSATGAVMLRCCVAAIVFAITLFIKDRSLLRIKVKDFWCFLGTGIISLLFFTYCYFSSMNYVSLSMAAILLYTAPSFVMVMSVIFFKEKLTGRKILSVIVAFAGCCLVSGIGTDDSISKTGLLFGLGAGIGYALYSIFARCALNRGYDSLTINFYSCALAGIGAGVIWGFSDNIVIMTASLPNFAICVIAGISTCYLPYLFYTYGLSGLETGIASILTSLEPVVATLVGVLIYKETLTVGGVLGILFVLSAIVILNMKTKSKVS